MGEVISINGREESNKIKASQVLEAVKILEDNIDSISILMTLKGSKDVHISSNIKSAEIIKLINIGLLGIV